MFKIFLFIFIGSLFLGCGEGACCATAVEKKATNITAKNIDEPNIATITLKKQLPSTAVFDLVFSCKCNGKEYDGGKMIVDKTSPKVDFNLTDKMLEIQQKYPNQKREYRVVNSNSIYLDQLHTLEDIEKNLKVWIEKIVD